MQESASQGGLLKPAQPITYASAGVDTEAGDRAVELMKSAVQSTFTPQVWGGSGGFAGMVDISELRSYRQPLLATSTDGVGTKVAIAQAMDIHHTIGQDLVGMVVDDIAVVGAKPLFMTDYIACGSVVPTRIADIVRGIAQACSKVGAALLGGETAEHPGLLGPHEYDVAGAVTGVVEADELLGPHLVQPGDVLVALAASGLHSNGYSLVRRVVSSVGWEYGRYVPEFGRTLGEELLEPTRLYSALCLELAEEFRAGQAGSQAAGTSGEAGTGGAAVGIHAFSHITGGGLGANLARVLPAHLAAVVNRDTWLVPPVFQVMQGLGQVPWDDLEGTLNLGVGMVAVVSADAVGQVQALATRAGVESWILGEVFMADGVQGRVPAEARVISGTKGVDGGCVYLCGDYRL